MKKKRRMGGAVMGSKNLKAVAVKGTGSVAVAHPDTLKELNRLTIELNRREPMFLPFPKDQVRRIGKSSCYQCGVDCFFRSLLQTGSGLEMVRKCQAMFVYFQWVAGRPGESAETAMAATGICNDLSLCTMEMYNILNWLSTCFKSGYLTQKETGLDISEIGTLGFFKKLAQMIAAREGFGDILAEGLLRAGEKLGNEAKAHFSPEVSGVGDPSLESRIFTAVTGIEIDEAGLNTYGERIFNLERAILIREGWRPLLDDKVAEFNYTQPVQSVSMNPGVLVPGPENQVLSRKGMVLDQKEFETMRKEFYALRGWDVDTGVQLPETLRRLQL